MFHLFFLSHWFLSFLIIKRFWRKKAMLEGTSSSTTSTSSTTTVPFRCRTLVEDNVEVEMQRFSNGWNLRGMFFCYRKLFKNTLVVVGYIGSGYKWLEGVLEKNNDKSTPLLWEPISIGKMLRFHGFSHSAESDRFHPPRKLS